MSAESGVFLAALVLLVGYKAVTGEINTVGLVSDKATRELSPSRVQLLGATLFGAGYWLLQVLDASTGQQLPEVPRDLLLLLGGSHALYLGTKLRAAN
jgi:hypothetical protein